MISRHLLRIKILQILFAHYRNGVATPEALDKELGLSVEKTHHLYHLLMQLPVELVAYAQNRIDLAKQKLRPTPEDLNPNTRFVDNAIVQQLAASKTLRKYLDTNRLNWRNNPEMIKSLYQRLCSSDNYKAYMAAPTCSLDDDRMVVANFVLKELDRNDDLLLMLEEQSIYWNDDIDLVASMASKTIKRLSGQPDEEPQLMPIYRCADDEDYARRLLSRTLMRHTENLELINQFTQNWDVDRIANIDILIMEMAITEILEFPSIPIKVSLNEYIEIVKYYGTEQSSTFVNGVLDRVVASLREQQLVQKQGRGLVGEDDSRLK